MYQDTGPKNTCLLFLGDDDKCNKDVLTGVQTCPNRQVETESTCWLYLGGDDRRDKDVLIGVQVCDSQAGVRGEVTE